MRADALDDPLLLSVDQRREMLRLLAHLGTPGFP